MTHSKGPYDKAFVGHLEDLFDELIADRAWQHSFGSLSDDIERLAYLILATF
jgi:hypothetical protein